ncbi:MAG: hypothetical protein CMO47_00400 [Verrucomicrobiales bacterium]|nr:hypothetical protein [Verrucomicrobiales bacterium]
MDEDRKLALEASYITLHTAMRKALKESIKAKNPLVKAQKRAEWQKLVAQCTALETELGIREPL